MLLHLTRHIRPSLPPRSLLPLYSHTTSLHLTHRRFASSRSDRNRSTTFQGSHKELLTPEQHVRRRERRRAFVLGRDNVVRNFEPGQIDLDALRSVRARVGAVGMSGADASSGDGDGSLTSKGLGLGLGYAVKRTDRGFLPVYTEFRNGRGQITTLIRRIDGDVHQLRRDLCQCGVVGKQEDVEVRETTGHVRIKGRVERVVRYWLTAVGF